MRIRPLWIKIAAVVMTLAVLAALLLCLFSEIRAYRTRITENAQSIADAHTQAYADATEQVLAGMMTEVKAIAIGLQQATTEYEAADIISRGAANSAWIMGSRFMAKGQLYSGYALYTGAPQSEVVRLYESGKEGIVGIVYDSGFGGVQCIVFGVPVAENAAGVTYLMAYCQDLKLYERLDTALAEQKAPGMADIMYLCHDGKMYHPQGIGEHFLASKYNNAFQMMLDVGVPTDAIDPLKNDYYGGRSHSVSFDMDGETYLASLFFLDGTDRTLSIMAIYTDTALIAEDQAFADMLFAIVAAIVLVMVGVLAFAVYCILHKGEREAVRAIDPVAKCNAFDYYAALSSRIVHSTKYPHYAVISLKVHYFNYYMEQYGEEFCKEMLQFVAKSIDRCVQNDEVMGYRGEGEFAITMHYTDDNELIGRIKLLHAILIVCPPVKEKNDKLRTACGIYPVTRQDHSSIETMVEKAAIAIASKNFDINAVYSFYTDETSAIVQRETEMERKMEMALKDGSFRVFYQPKYGVAEKGVHSAEALIRWYDAETGHYYYPADFLRLFEENGFIVEMDKFVIRQVATLLQDLTVRNIKVVPISVNISRVTAAQKDFVDFCMKIRQDFNLPNDLMTFEFSESFAHYDYEAMSRTLEVLEGRGFVCAIDGYGSGYSSYSILKELKFTEIKLDRFFLRKSARPERDREVLGDVIALSRKLGLRVVQEGVESQADFEWLIAQGCDAIQGFYYSKPLGMQDFIDFISKTELYGLGEIPGKNPDEKPADS